MIKKFYKWLHNITSKPEEANEYSAGYWQSKVRAVAIELCRKKKGKLLEVGCGEGLFLAELALANKELQIYGIDRWKVILQKADKRLNGKGIKNVSLSLMDAASLSFEDSYFDTVVCINVLFNLESLGVVKKVLIEIARVCKKNGRVIFDFRNSKNPLLYFKYKLAPYYDKTVKNLPLKTYSLEGMRSLSEELGFKIISDIPIGFFIKRIAPIIILKLEKQ